LRMNTTQADSMKGHHDPGGAYGCWRRSG